MLKSTIFIFILIFINQLGECCSCQTAPLKEIQDYVFEEAETILIIQANGTYKQGSQFFADLIVLEVLKGDKSIKKITAIEDNSCSVLPSRVRWIVYGKIRSDGFFDIPGCGLSRSFDNPEWINAKEYKPMPPLQEDQSQESIDYPIGILDVKLKALEDLKNEIIELRSQDW